MSPRSRATSRPGGAPRWVSLHVYYADDQDRLLLDGVAPLLRRLRTDRLLAGYFFLRYDLGGPHVRLRLAPSDAAPAARLESLARARLQEYLTAHPSQPAADRVQDSVRDAYVLRWEVSERLGPAAPNNSVRPVEYRPETERYGSGEGLRTVETHFERSSDLALELIRRTPREHRADLGLELLLTSPVVLGEPNRWPDYYRWHRNTWLGHPPPDWPDAAVHELLAKVRQRLHGTAARRLRAMLGGEPVVGFPAARWQPLLVEVVQGFAAVKPLTADRRAAFAAAMTHLLLNRCGLSPVVEGCLADVALTAYQEASYV